MYKEKVKTVNKPERVVNKTPPNNNFDYTEWRKNLWQDKSVEELHKMATEYEKNKSKNPS